MCICIFVHEICVRFLPPPIFATHIGPTLGLSLSPRPPRSSSSPATLVLVALGGLVYFFLCLSMVWQDIAAGLAAVDRVLFVRILGFRSVAAAE